MIKKKNQVKNRLNYYLKRYQIEKNFDISKYDNFKTIKTKINEIIKKNSKTINFNEKTKTINLIVEILNKYLKIKKNVLLIDKNFSFDKNEKNKIKNRLNYYLKRYQIEENFGISRYDNFSTIKAKINKIITKIKTNNRKNNKINFKELKNNPNAKT